MPGRPLELDTALHNVALLDPALHNVALPGPALHNVALFAPALHNVALLGLALHNVVSCSMLPHLQLAPPFSASYRLLLLAADPSSSPPLQLKRGS